MAKLGIPEGDERMIKTIPYIQGLNDFYQKSDRESGKEPSQEFQDYYWGFKKGYGDLLLPSNSDLEKRGEEVDIHSYDALPSKGEKIKDYFKEQVMEILEDEILTNYIISLLECGATNLTPSPINGKSEELEVKLTGIKDMEEFCLELEQMYFNKRYEGIIHDVAFDRADGFLSDRKSNMRIRFLLDRWGLKDILMTLKKKIGDAQKIGNFDVKRLLESEFRIIEALRSIAYGLQQTCLLPKDQKIKYRHAHDKGFENNIIVKADADKYLPFDGLCEFEMLCAEPDNGDEAREFGSIDSDNDFFIEFFAKFGYDKDRLEKSLKSYGSRKLFKANGKDYMVINSLPRKKTA